MNHTINQSNLTPHFRNLLREENPSWEPWEIMRWTWDNGPVFSGTKLDTKEMDSRHPGGSAIGLMYYHIKSGKWELTRIRPVKFIF